MILVSSLLCLNTMTLSYVEAETQVKSSENKKNNEKVLVLSENTKNQTELKPKDSKIGSDSKSETDDHDKGTSVEEKQVANKENKPMEKTDGKRPSVRSEKEVPLLSKGLYTLLPHLMPFCSSS